ncbi:hypothetical protein QUB29_26465 [Microcoleus sp. B4b_D2]|uniref:hypothetical protein n=1 Tax=Microcoleus sp. B4b_D2 TaxID=3055310 RepID=UPI002FD5DF15
MRIKLLLLLALGIVGLGVGIGTQPVDTQCVLMGDRVRPCWLVGNEKVLARRQGAGVLRLVGAIVGAGAFATALHFAGEDKEEQAWIVAVKSIWEAARLKGEQLQAAAYLQFVTDEIQTKVDLNKATLLTQTRTIFTDKFSLDLPALPHSSPGTLDEIAKQGKVEESDCSAPSLPDSSRWVEIFDSQTGLVWGNQGGGKSWFLRLLAQRKKEQGYRVIVLDPDSNRSEWRGLESYHLWEEIEREIRRYLKELKTRYTEFAKSEISENEWRKRLWDEGKAIALICDECTTYGDFIKDEELLKEFARLAVTKSRKQEMPVTFAAHNNTQTCLFGISRLNNLVQKMLQVEFLAEVDLRKSPQPKASGKARIKLDSSREWREVLVPFVDSKVVDFMVETPPTSSDSPPSLPQSLHQLESLLHLDSTDFDPIPTGWRFPDPMAPLSPDVRAVIVACKRKGMSQNSAIQAIWGIVKSGSDKRYEAARLQYQQVIVK